MKNEIVRHLAKKHLTIEKLHCTYRGYYLVHSSGRYFISKNTDSEALEAICNKVLTNDFDYWIDYSYGKDTEGNPAWSNIDYTDDFI